MASNTDIVKKLVLCLCVCMSVSLQLSKLDPRIVDDDARGSRSTASQVGQSVIVFAVLRE